MVGASARADEAPALGGVTGTGIGGGGADTGELSISGFGELITSGSSGSKAAAAFWFSYTYHFTYSYTCFYLWVRRRACALKPVSPHLFNSSFGLTNLDAEDC
ncbi:hypothetical protein AK812_SmicGene44999 [Symbiodinium microadriaticum]|uniref:Uncharacterized protein n=1 Tax=Symbiodinium microadriaticum TaxID=2951 RepID=A0A1Q9BX12_SYMMI|nr:hypothetical protein AK812_SmicGene44999 [Symbiodinium microadriaticum]